MQCVKKKKKSIYLTSYERWYTRLSAIKIPWVYLIRKLTVELSF